MSAFAKCSTNIRCKKVIFPFLIRDEYYYHLLGITIMLGLLTTNTLPHSFRCFFFFGFFQKLRSYLPFLPRSHHGFLFFEKFLFRFLLYTLVPSLSPPFDFVRVSKIIHSLSLSLLLSLVHLYSNVCLLHLSFQFPTTHYFLTSQSITIIKTQYTNPLIIPSHSLYKW